MSENDTFSSKKSKIDICMKAQSVLPDQLSKHLLQSSDGILPVGTRWLQKLQNVNEEVLEYIILV